MKKYESRDLYFLWEWLECSGRNKGQYNSATPVEEFLIAPKNE